MNFSDYQTQSRATANYPDMGENFVFPTLGIVGESGEIAEKVKKLVRDKTVMKPDEVSEEDKNEIIKELGDVLWYMAQLATEFGIEFDEVAARNLAKTKDRKDRGKIGGSGDNR